MGLNPQKGALGFAPQTVFGSLETTLANYVFYRVTSLPQILNREVAQLDPEIGGVRGNAGSFISGFTVGDQVGMFPRGKQFGKILKSVTGEVATSTGTPEAGVNTITFTPGDTKRYLSCIRRVETQWAEAIQDVIVGSIDFEFAAGRPLTATLGLLGRNAGQFTAMADNDITSLWDTSDPLMCVGDDSGTGPYIKLEGSTLSADTWGGVRRARVRLSNEAQPDGFVIGSMWQPGFTYTNLILSLEAEIAIKDHNLYQRVYYNSTSAVAGNLGTLTSLASTVRAGSFAFKAKSMNNIPSKTVPYSLEIKSANSIMELTMIPVALQGNQIVVCTLTGNMKLHTDNTSYSIELITDGTVA